VSFEISSILPLYNLKFSPGHSEIGSGSVQLMAQNFDIASSSLLNANSFFFCCRASCSQSFRPDKGGQKYASSFSSLGFHHKQEEYTGAGQQSSIRDDPLSCEFVLYHFHQYLTFVGSLHKIWEGDVTSKISDPSFANFD